MRSLRPSIRVMLCLLCLAAASSVRADSFTYTYTGPTFDTYTGTVTAATCTPFCNITGFFTLSAPIGANENFFNVPFASPLSFSSGGLTFDPSNSTGTIFVSTDGSGAIDGWEFSLTGNTNHVSLFGINNGDVGDEYISFTQDGSNFAIVGVGSNLGTPGTWAEVTTTPEPPTFLLFGGAMLATFILLKKKMLAA